MVEGPFRLPSGAHNLVSATVNLQKSDPFRRSSSLNTTCLWQYSRPFLSFVFYREFTIYIPEEHPQGYNNCSHSALPSITEFEDWMDKNWDLARIPPKKSAGCIPFLI